MARLSRKLRVCKWIGMVGCVLILASFVLSKWWMVGLGWKRALDAPGLAVAINSGIVLLLWLDLTPPSPAGWEFDIAPAKRGLPYEPASFPSTLEFHEFGQHIHYLLLPLWLPFLILLLPTLLLWWRDRRKPRPGFCRRCDYDLSGNTSGRCPECGTEVVQRAISGPATASLRQLSTESGNEEERPGSLSRTGRRPGPGGPPSLTVGRR